ncbi:MAG: hypothetical protein GX813_01645 [Erysipelotrichia bacterium]|nr:hypothetical protein [Erysipelotrichia bacterium]
MIEKYGLINNFDKANSYLTVLFEDLDEGIVPKKDGDVLLYMKNKRMVRLDIFRLAKFVKIKFKGLIALPNIELIAIINSYLGQYGCLLATKRQSGFYFAKQNGHLVVKVKKDILTADGTFVKSERIATAYDLDVDDDKVPLVVETVNQ